MKLKHFVILVCLVCLTSFLLTREKSVQGQVTGSAPSSSLHMPLDDASYSVVSLPQLSAARINAILSAYSSPFAGDGQFIYDLGRTYQISSDYALAFWLYESAFGTAGEARVTRNPGNLRCIPGFACTDDYAQFASWRQGIERWYLLIHLLYVGQWGLTTVDQIIPRYAPAADHNNEAGYIAALKNEVDGWRAGKVVL